MIRKFHNSRYFFPVLIALALCSEAYHDYSIHSRISQLEAKQKAPPCYKDDEASTRAFVGKLRLCELACYGLVKKFSESTDTCECMEKPLD